MKPEIYFIYFHTCRSKFNVDLTDFVRFLNKFCIINCANILSFYFFFNYASFLISNLFQKYAFQQRKNDLKILPRFLCI